MLDEANYKISFANEIFKDIEINTLPKFTQNKLLEIKVL